MTELFLLALGSFLASGAVAYYWWSTVRMTFLRERLFAIRDELWLEALRLKCFDDPGYQAAREHLNATIRAAKLWSVKVLDVFAKSCATVPAAVKPRSECCEMQLAIDKSLDRAANEVARYILLHRASGWIKLAKSAVRSVDSRVRRRVAFKDPVEHLTSYQRAQLQGAHLRHFYESAFEANRDWARSPVAEDLSQLDWMERKYGSRELEKTAC